MPLQSTMHESGSVPAKKRRVSRACDNCRRRKGKCDGLPDSGSRCSTCASFNMECTYHDTLKKRGPRRKPVKSLEQTTEEEAVQGLARPLSCLLLKAESVSAAPSPRGPSPYCEESSSEDEAEHGPPLYETFTKIDLEPRPIYTLSSTRELVESSMKLDKQLQTRASRQEWAQKNRWVPDPWELEGDKTAERALHQRDYDFPDEDLIPLLVDSYFTHYNAFVPLLHRPTFEYNLAERAHLRDNGFGAIVLIVCALGARYVDDERVYLPRCSPRSAGWRWYNQLQVAQKPLLNRPRLCDVQLYILAVLFLSGSSNVPSLWTLVGIAQRVLMDIGAHTRRFYSKTPNPRDELWKRAFWVILCLDRILATDMGRPTLMREDDYDVAYPIDCDDEFWMTEDPVDAFVQPSDKPSSLTFFIQYIQLQNIRAFAMHNLISSKAARQSADNQDIVVQIDSDMNQWLDALPEHLRWDPLREDTLFFHQSATLYTEFHALQIVIHRPSAVSRVASPAAFTSLAICTNAARSTSHIFSVQVKRPQSPIYSLHIVVRTLNAAIILVLGMHSGQRLRSHVNIARELEDVQKCIHILEQCSAKSAIAKFALGLLSRFASLDRQLSPSVTSAPAKRRLDTETNADELANKKSTWQNIPPTRLPHNLEQASDGAPLMFQASGPALQASAIPASDTSWLNTSFAPSYTKYATNPQSGLPGGSNTGDPFVEIMSSLQLHPLPDDLFTLWADVPSSLGILDWASYLDELDGSGALHPEDASHFNVFGV